MEKMTDQERTRLTGYISETGVLVRNTVARLSHDQLRFRPGHDRWSIGEILEHLTTLETLVLAQIQDVVGTPGSPEKSAWVGQDDELIEQVKSRVPPIKAPEIISPQSGKELSEVIAEFQKAHDRVWSYATTTEDPLRSYCFAHPVLGNLDCYQWLLCQGAHRQRHLLQIYEVMNSTEVPRSCIEHTGDDMSAAPSIEEPKDAKHVQGAMQE